MTSPRHQTPRHTPNPRGQGDRLRQDLIEATNRLLEQGATHESLSLRAVAREVGIAATSVYLHFPDKMSLLLAVYQEHFAVLARHLDDAVAAHAEPDRQLHAVADAYCQFAEDHPDAYQVMFTVPHAPPVTRPLPDDERPGLAAIEITQNVFKACADAGLARTPDPYLATLCLWGALHGLLTLRAARPTVPWPPLNTLVDTLMATHLDLPQGLDERGM
ncbi:TetR/AcrR family transcriptional regulator [Nonomuraea sp. NPDC052116]|uniref:TetR/AcrR family transcriptional regulator n=1 Tax=Nonomuraea sp. NPDC052116 TaxID=3155665 RepID=UPI00343FD518